MQKAMGVWLQPPLVTSATLNGPSSNKHHHGRNPTTNTSRSRNLPHRPCNVVLNTAICAAAHPHSAEALKVGGVIVTHTGILRPDCAAVQCGSVPELRAVCCVPHPSPRWPALQSSARCATPCQSSHLSSPPTHVSHQQQAMGTEEQQTCAAAA